MLTENQTSLLDERIADLCAALPLLRNLQYGGLLPDETYAPQPIKKGQRWQRLVNDNGNQRGCHMWVDRTNGMLTYGGWKAPTKNRQGIPAYRYDLLDDAAYATLMVRVLTERRFWLYEDKITKACH